METKLSSLIRDLISVAVGAFGLIHSQITGVTSPELLAIYTALLGYPGILQLLELRRKPPNGGGGSSGES